MGEPHHGAMFERFSNKARHVVVLAQEEARGLQHNYIGTEHILLGLLGETEGVGARALQGFGLSLEGAREEVLARVGVGKKTVEGHIPFTPRAKKVLELALREALTLQHNYIGTEHILLGLVREADGVGAQIVAAHAPEPVAVRVRMAVLDLMPAAPTETRRGWLRRRRANTPDDQSEPAQLETTVAADTTLSEAARLAGPNPVGSQHLLLAALGDPDSAAARALAAAGLDLDRATDALRAVDITGTSDEAPEDAGRRSMRVRSTDDLVTIEVADPALVDLAHAALDALGDQAGEARTIPGDLAVSASLGSVWLALRESLTDIRRRAAATTGPGEPPAAA
jgi:ATP-dependent Clp protease ATP-binding subunit ClpA